MSQYKKFDRVMIASSGLLGTVVSVQQNNQYVSILGEWMYSVLYDINRCSIHFAHELSAPIQVESIQTAFRNERYKKGDRIICSHTLADGQRGTILYPYESNVQENQPAHMCKYMIQLDNGQTLDCRDYDLDPL
jgi:hypothetical protein